MQVSDDNGNSQYWVRTPGNGQDTALCVRVKGFLDVSGVYVSNCGIGIRHAMWVSY